MPTIAIIAGVRIIIYPEDHLPPHLHARFAEFEVMISILTGDVLEGSMPEAKLREVQAWLVANREPVAYVWQEVRALRYTGGRIDQ
ncbi:MAG: DUF4160 domain-containing protein [Rhodopseudomonas palustris]|uniref:DUF4160 domain-containing protein n=1 Tax=Rhodopseudomonas palustris TaxID=1076 RepID=A0A933S2M1_RHOPL|nr:DUF4160 domain-containing protein [Rhodopseudomonas palustris]